jgi:hypothetical protein
MTRFFVKKFRNTKAAKACTLAVRDVGISGIAIGEYHADYSIENYTFDEDLDKIENACLPNAS